MLLKLLFRGCCRPVIWNRVSGFAPGCWNRAASNSPVLLFRGGFATDASAASRQNAVANDSSVKRRRRRLLLIALSLSAGVSYAYYRASRKATKVPHPAKDWQVSLYRFLPWNSVSRFWGWINDVNLPVPMRKPVLGLYARLFNCNLEEAEDCELCNYKNLGEFFRRRLKPGTRPVDPSCVIVAPADGKVLHFGKVDCGLVEQIKGITYPLPEFIGAPTWLHSFVNQDTAPVAASGSSEPLNIPTDLACDPNLMYECGKYEEFLKQKPSGTSLFHFVIYLAPGDYHCFHVPTDWTMKFRRHFSGDLLSVNPEICALVRGLFSINERVVYTGQWKHGFFSMAAIGATNVGSIRIYADEELRTNLSTVTKGSQVERNFADVTLKKGEPFGEFNLGSTIVLIFEAPSSLQFCVKPGDSVKVGQAILSSL